MLNMAKTASATRPPIQSVAKYAAALSLSLVLLIGLILGIVWTVSSTTKKVEIPETVVGISYTTQYSMDDMIQREQHEVLRTF